MDIRQRSRRFQPRRSVSWTAWIRTGTCRLRCHTIDLSANGARLRPRGEMQPGTPIDVQLQPPDGPAVDVAAVVWRVDSDSMAVMFLRSVGAQITTDSRRPENGRRGWR